MKTFLYYLSGVILAFVSIMSFLTFNVKAGIVIGLGAAALIGMGHYSNKNV